MNSFLILTVFVYTLNTSNLLFFSHKSINFIFSFDRSINYRCIIPHVYICCYLSCCC